MNKITLDEILKGGRLSSTSFFDLKENEIKKLSKTDVKPSVLNKVNSLFRVILESENRYSDSHNNTGKSCILMNSQDLDLIQ